jgi:hypothetical protein
MILLPRGNPVKEQINPGKVNLPEALEKLRQGKFTGYLRFNFADSTGIFIFDGGRFADALFDSAHDSLLARTAIARIFSESLKGHGSLGIYRLSPELTGLVRAVLHSELLHQGQELELINVRGLLKRLRDERLNGCLRVYAGSRVALILYRQGQPLGFFHDGAAELAANADYSCSVARDAGAKIDVLAAPDPATIPLVDLWGAADLAELWQAALRERQGGDATASPARGRSVAEDAGGGRGLLLGVLRKTAQRYLGAFGVSLVEKEFAALAGGALDEGLLAGFYPNLARAAELVIEADQVDQMLAEMKQAVRPLLVNR